MHRKTRSSHPFLAERMISRVSIEQIQGVITVSKGNKAICMRLPPAILELMEAEAAAEGVSVPELCRRKIVEGSPSVGMERATGQVAPIPTTPTSVYPAGSPSIVTPTPSPVTSSQRLAEALAAGTTAQALTDLQAEFPELSPPTEAMITASKRLAKLDKERPEVLDKWAEESILHGMSGLELVEFNQRLAIQGIEQEPAAKRKERKTH